VARHGVVVDHQTGGRYFIIAIHKNRLSVEASLRVLQNQKTSAMIQTGKKTKRVLRRVLREEIREQLIDDILSGRLPPGTRIVETRLAQEMGVSQAPVREALRDLELFGFVTSSPFRGTQVRKISIEDLLEVYPVRAALESVAARTAAACIDDETLVRLAELIDSMRQAAARGDHRAHVDADFQFHQTIIKASGNRMLQHVWQTMRLATTTFVTHSMTQLTHRSLDEIGERHVPVLEALRAHDPQLAEAAMRRHIEEPGDWIRDAIAASEKDAAGPAEQPAAAGESAEEDEETAV
jgi:DNA-binding GntR family transcriptional regulator